MAPGWIGGRVSGEAGGIGYEKQDHLSDHGSTTRWTGDALLCNAAGCVSVTLSQRGIIMMRKLTGKVALVTGGSRSIGAAIVKRLAADGAAVALTYGASPNKADAVVHAIEAAGGKALAIRADAGDVA